MSASPQGLARLDAWLRDYEVSALAYATEQLREAVEHFAECDGMDRTCAGITDQCGDSDPQECSHCATDCEDCLSYRKGWRGAWTNQPPVTALIEEVEARQSALFEFAS